MTPDGQAFTAPQGASKQSNIVHLHSHKITLRVCLAFFYSITMLATRIEKMTRVIQLHIFNIYTDLPSRHSRKSYGTQ